ncbi:MAG: chromosome segregation protein SMC, partial [Verrucomicrobiota bacterium]
MRLKSLDIHGFKSFADKTKLEFHEGVTGIVGPNGCGKSNIVDAMRWVLGETSAKALRGGEMADVIFNGTDKRSPLGMAEVTLTLSDCADALKTDFDEVALGRRVFRDGKSEYLINKQPCRLKDIHGLLMDTGIGRSSYSIMEQGKIDMLLSSKPEDRRAVFEEAAGITKYKSQKKEALRKLDYTEANLIRIRDVIAENERQIRSLSRQASKAKRYQSLFDDVKTLELHLSHKQWRELRAEKSELNTSINALQIQQDNLEDDIEKRQARMAAARVEYQETENRLSALQTELARLENEIGSATNRIEFNGERTHELSVLIKRNEENITEATGKKERQESDIEAADRQLAAVNERILTERSKVTELEEKTREARSVRESVNQRLRELEEERSQLKSQIGSLDATIETNTSQLESDQQRSRQLTDEISRLRGEESSRQSDAAELKDRISTHQKSIEEFEERLAEMDQKYHQAKRAAATMQEDLSALSQLHAEKRSRLEVLEQLVAEGEGFEKGTQSVLKGVDESGRFQRKVFGPLSRSVDVELKYAEAIEAALGNRLQTVLISDREATEQIISSLRENHLGQACLIAQSDLEASQQESPGEAPLGAIGWAVDHVQVEDRFEGLLSRLLRDVLLAEDLTTALRLREEHPEFAVASLEGTFVSKEGIIQGGKSGDESVSVLKMQGEITELKEATEALKEEVEARQLRKDDLNQRVDQLEETLQVARERLQQKRVASSTLEGKLALVERDLNQFRNKIESLEWEQREVRERETKISADREANEVARAQANGRVETLSEESESLSTRLSTAQHDEESLTEEVTEARTSLAVEDGTRQNLEEQREPMVARLLELEELIEKASGEIENYRDRITRANEESEQLQHQITNWKETTEKTHEERSSILVKKSGYSAQIEEGEEELTRKRREVQDVAGQRGREEVKVAQLDLGLENLERTCRDRYRTELEFFEPDSHALLLAIEERRKNG